MTHQLDPKTLQTQADASNPRASAWVSANAGSGKTYVLSRRVIRLLLSGVNPSRILCLTFTKAAAAEMAKRVFGVLSDWTVASDQALAAEIAALEGQAPDSKTLLEARRLFARALETPGGLKIQTIHAFCERLLHQFPFEANVAGHFEVLDERNAAALADAARRSVLAAAAREPKGVLGQALERVLGQAADSTIEAAIGEFVAKRDQVSAWIATAGNLDRALAGLRHRLALAPGETADSLGELIVDESAFSLDGLARLVAALQASDKKTDREAAARLAPLLTAPDTAGRAAAYRAFFTTASGDLRKATSLITKAVKESWEGLAERLDAERERLDQLFDRIRAAECFEATEAMLRLVDGVIADYARRKRAGGYLDFDDLIVRTAHLLSRVDAAQWVHYKLDRGLDHILVDEAQDTSPRQWQVIKALAEEFFAGEGAGVPFRTLFAVGDEKQSIFSFQGAVPAWFARMQRELGRRARAGDYAWHDLELHLSFRSTPAVLSAVDTVFAREAAYHGLASEARPPVHEAWRRNDPGRVTIWPMIAPPERPVPEDWTTPLDRLDDKSPAVQLAERIAATIAGWLDKGETLEATGKPVRAGGILVLLRHRGVLFEAINRALKTQGIPIAGADRLPLTSHIAVMDLMALAQVMLLPEDDLSLAAVLKSPLIGLDEEALYDLAYEREGTLWEALATAAADDQSMRTAFDRLQNWRARADFLDPHAFFAGILGPEKGRQRLLARLGQEAEDVLDEFLAQALAFEEANTPSLQGFLDWLAAAPTEIKRDTDMLRDEVRVMTVHGAKGLEADIVFLVDAGAAPVHGSHDPKVIALDEDGDGIAPAPLVWMRGPKLMPDQVKTRVDSLRERVREEYRRLLYVGLTRARDRLLVCGTLKTGTDAEGGWHGLVTQALEPECRRIEGPDGALEALEWRPGAGEGAKPVAAAAPERTPEVEKPDWLEAPAPVPPTPLRRLAPSAALGPTGAPPGPASEAGEAAAEALSRGRLIHRLLQSLPDQPSDDRRAIAGRYLAGVTEWPEAERAALVDEVIAVIDDPTFAPVFAGGSRAEVDLAGRLTIEGNATALSGRIDRLAVTDERVIVVDYKTNRPAPERLEDVPAAYVAQLALYRRMLTGLYPGRPVVAAILWTERPALMEIPASTLDAALATMRAG